jgi:pantetheine-phosphate adenylyltransferase
MTTVGIYAGSFNPFHIGHWDILNQAIELFDTVIVARGQNPSKTTDKVPLPVKSIRNCGAECAEITGLLTDYISESEKANPGVKYWLIRGLRNGADLQYEQNQLAFYRGLKKDIRIVFLSPSKDVEHVSSSALRGIRPYSESEYLKYVIE